MTMFCEPALQQWQKIVPHLYFEGQIHPPKCLINDFICISVMCRFTNLRKKIKTALLVFYGSNSTRGFHKITEFSCNRKFV